MKDDEDLFRLVGMVFLLVPVALGVGVMTGLGGRESFSAALCVVMMPGVVHFVIRNRWDGMRRWMTGHLYVCLGLGGVGLGYWGLVGLVGLAGWLFK